MTRSCTNCGAPVIEGITPYSPGWCSAECDLRPSAKVSSLYAGDLWGYKGDIGRMEDFKSYYTKQRFGTIAVKVVHGEVRKDIDGLVDVWPVDGFIEVIAI